MSKKKGLYDRLNTSVADQSSQARDKFDNADLVVAMSRLKQQRPEQTAMEAPQAGIATEQVRLTAQASSYTPPPHLSKQTVSHLVLAVHIVHLHLLP